jgi:acetyltransferase
MNLGHQELLQKMERGFNPRNVAVVGAARHNQFRWLKCQMPFFENFGKLYHVNVDKDEWAGAEELGVPNYMSLLDIPDEIDYVTISVPRQVVPRILEDCVKKGVAVAHVFAAGFGEIDEDEGRRLDGVVRQIAEAGNLAVIGPNCMGLYNGLKGIRQDANQVALEPGYIGYISQSGSQAIGFTMEAASQGVPTSMCFSMGNGLVLDIHDYVDYLAQDEATKVIGMFAEGPRDPVRFFQSVEAATKVKPVLVWKMGQTEDSARATQAHTGTPYLRAELWDQLMARSGATAVDSVDELIDTAKAITMIRPATGVRIGILAATGGHSTEMANVFSKEGFRCVPLTERSYERLASFFNLIGGNYVNPIQGSAERFGDIMEILGQDENLDLVTVELSAGRLAADETHLNDRIAILQKFQRESSKPLVAIVTTSFPRVESSALEALDKKFSAEGIPIFYTFQRAARALKNTVAWHSVRSYLGNNA